MVYVFCPQSVLGSMLIKKIMVRMVNIIQVLAVTQKYAIEMSVDSFFLYFVIFDLY